ncbi:hypothetical protein [Nocardia sp. NPDC058705]|uniref:hypothetical protein n=1 Tax=Nocardia sp. NPDC058705 TaxID=3346609 RepID=UPI0036974B21
MLTTHHSERRDDFVRIRHDHRRRPPGLSTAARLLHRYLGWPFIAVIAFEIACKSLLLVAAIVEVPLVSSALAMVLPTASGLTIDSAGWLC